MKSVDLYPVCSTSVRNTAAQSTYGIDCLSQEPANGDVVIVEDEDHQALMRRWYRDSSTLMLVAHRKEVATVATFSQPCAQYSHSSSVGASPSSWRSSNASSK